MSYQKEAIAALAEKIKQSGFRVFLAEKGTYGFFTDDKGKKIISFECNLGNVKFHGNYKTDNPARTGNGWGLPDTNADSLGDYGIQATFDNAYPPSWAVGDAKWTFTTLEQYQATYQASSKYREI